MSWSGPWHRDPTAPKLSKIYNSSFASQAPLDVGSHTSGDGETATFCMPAEVKMTRRGQRGGGAGRNKTVRLKGLFSDGQWYCNCTPRLPAVRRRVSKEDSPNKGKWFYSCDLDREDPKNCKFFLWEDEAKSREEAVVINNGKPEMTPQNQYLQDANGINVTAHNSDGAQPRYPDLPKTPPRGPRARCALDISPPPAYSDCGHDRGDNFSFLKRSEKRRKAPEGPDPGDLEDGEWGTMTQEEEEALFSSPSATMRRHPPETPRKVFKSGEFSTPRGAANGGSPAGGNPFFSNNNNNNNSSEPRTQPSKQRPLPPPFGLVTPSTTRSNTITSNSDSTAISPSAPQTPTTIVKASRTPSSALTSPSPVISPSTADDETSSLPHAVLTLLHTHYVNLSTPTTTALHALLSRHALRAQGIAKGRDITRLGLKAKEAKIAELDLQIARLKAELDVEKATVGHLRWRMRQEGVEVEDE